MDKNRDYWACRVRTYDYDRYFAATLCAPETRRALLVLYAFNLEIASISEKVSEPLAGEIRFQWWREVIEQINSCAPVRRGLAQDLARVIEEGELPIARFERMIEARSRELEPEAIKGVEDLEHYAEETAGNLAALACRICGQTDRLQPVVDLGAAWALTGMLRSVPLRAPAYRLLENAGLTGPRALDQVATRARNLLEASQSAVLDLPRTLRPSVGYLPVAASYLSRLQRSGGNVYSSGLGSTRLTRQLQILRTILTGRM